MHGCTFKPHVQLYAHFTPTDVARVFLATDDTTGRLLGVISVGEHRHPTALLMILQRKRRKALL